MHGKVLIIGALMPLRTSENLVGGFGFDELVLFGIRLLAANVGPRPMRVNQSGDI